MSKISIMKENPLIIKKILVSGLFGTGIVFAMLILSSILICNKILPQGREAVISEICLFAGAFSSGIITSHKVKERKAMAAMLSGLIICFVSIFVGVFNKNCNVFNINTLINLGISIIGAFLGSALVVKKRKRKRH